jgi:acetyl-CoA synthetase
MAKRPISDTAGDHWAAMQQAFRWRVPRQFNIAQMCSRRWAQSDDASRRVAVIAHRPEAEAQFHSYSELQAAADRLSSALRGLGVQRGDRVAIVMPQRFETAVAYMAVLQLGAIAMPLSQLFGPEALAYRIQNAEAAVALCDEASIEALRSVRADCPSLATVVGLGAAAAQADHDWQALLAGAAAGFEPVDSLADDPAILIYTSGTTGAPKGALIPHRALIGNLPGFLCSQNGFGLSLDFEQDGGAAVQSGFLPRTGEGGGGHGHLGDEVQDTPVFWSPADWAWTGGLMDALLPTLYFGYSIVAFNGRFSPELALQILAQHRVSHSFLFPTALKAMMKAVPHPRQHHALHLQGLMSAGEAVGDAVFAWCRDELGVIVNEMFGQTEVNYIVGNCALNGVATPGAGWPARPGSMGRGYPGHLVDVIDDAGQPCAPGVPGEVAIRRTDVHGDADPIFFLGYWRNEAATRAKFSGDWWRTGDMARRDEDGYLWYEGRADDVFKAAGYRIGPGEIENCLLKHPAVANCAVVPKPDAERGALVKAYVVLTPEFMASRASQWDASSRFDQELIGALQAHVKGQLAPYEYPKEIEFIDQLPMTTTGKVQRRVLRLQEEERVRAVGTG